MNAGASQSPAFRPEEHVRHSPEGRATGRCRGRVIPPERDVGNAGGTACGLMNAGGTAYGMANAGGTACGLTNAGGTACGLTNAGGTAYGMANAGGA